MWKALSLDDAGLPVMAKGEVVMVTTSDGRGTVAVTTERVLWWSKEGKQIALRDVKTPCYAKRGVLHVGSVELRVSNAEEIARACEQARTEKPKAQKQGFSASSAGIGGLVRKEKRRQKQADQLAADVQSDLKVLMKHAASVVDMLKRYQAKDEADEALGLMGGLWAHAGDQQALARHIVAFAMSKYFKDPDERRSAAAMVSLSDVYCAFNRARGMADLVSPEDFVAALQVFVAKGELDLPLELRTFPSGVKVLRPTRRKDAELTAWLLALATDGITDLAAAAHLQIPPPLARLHLLDAVNDGTLCLDDNPSGLAFYPNKFVIT